MGLLVVFGLFGTGMCAGAFLRGKLERDDFKQWQRELLHRGEDETPHYRRTF